jgi:SAM-dependent methyltransferase
MFDTYEEIFNQRGASYHEAMTRQPHVRDDEFRAILAAAQVQPGETIVDMPSGGGYLRNYLPDRSVKMIAVETCRAFYECAATRDDVQSMLCDLEAMPLEDASIDVVISLAGLHHARSLTTIFQEVRRILKPGGRFCLADGEEGSSVAGFLNRFVNSHNSMGHRGQFIDSPFIDQLRTSGLVIESDQPCRYSWNFESTSHMSRYCALLFGLDQATPEQIITGIQDHLGYQEQGGVCRMSWELRLIRCRKPE